MYITRSGQSNKAVCGRHAKGKGEGGHEEDRVILTEEI